MPPVLDMESNDISVDHTLMVERVIANLRAESGLLTLEDCAEIAGISPFYFNRIFRSIVGIPPGEFAASLRFEYAKELLLTTPASITEICFEAGYNSLGTFSTRLRSWWVYRQPRFAICRISWWIWSSTSLILGSTQSWHMHRAVFVEP